MSEEEVLNVHSPEAYSNVFRTNIPVKIVENSQGSIRCVFQEVIQLNTFLFDRCSNKIAKTLGELKKNLKPLILEPSQDGVYRLITKDENVKDRCSKLAEIFKFTLQPNAQMKAMNLLFSKKLDMFKFLFDHEAMMMFKTMQIDGEQIVNKDDIKVAERVESPVVGDHLEPCQLFDSQDVGLIESTATEVSVLETSLALKDDEIKSLKTELSHKNDIIGRQGKQIKKIENKFYEKESAMLKINQLVNRKTSNGDEELLSLKYTPSPQPKKEDPTVPKVMSLDSLLEPNEENSPRMMVEDILLELIDDIVDKVEAKDKDKPQLEFLFASNDIRYSKDGKKVQDPGSTDTGLSLFIVGLNSKTVVNMVNDIKKIPRSRSEYEAFSNPTSGVVRMDFLFKTAFNLKLFKTKCLKLSKPEGLKLFIKVVPSETMCIEEKPHLTEQELLLVASKEKTDNLFKAFEVKLVKEEDGNFVFQFQSIVSLNMFLFCTMGVEEDSPFLGHVRDKAWQLPRPLRLNYRKKGRDSVIHVSLTHAKFPKLNLSDVMNKFHASIFRQFSHKPEAQVNFPSKEDLYKFLTSKESRYFNVIKFDVKS